jgi:sugar-specific transcriptional regulator TrmB
MEKQKALEVLGLSKKEERVLQAVMEGLQTPVEISKKTGISRPAIYAILKHLDSRHLTTSHRIGGRKAWRMANNREVDEAFYEAKRAVLGIHEGKEELYTQADTGITLYRGKEALQELLRHLFEDHKGERYRGTQGDNVIPAWRELFGTETINTFNRAIKKNGMIVEAIMPKEYFERGVREFGPSWAKDFEGRTFRVNEIDTAYFNHGAEVFLFKDVLYLASMSEALVIEIRHSEIQKMIASLINYIQDTAKSVDGNEILRQIMARSSAT